MRLSFLFVPGLGSRAWRPSRTRPLVLGAWLPGRGVGLLQGQACLWALAASSVGSSWGRRPRSLPWAGCSLPPCLPALGARLVGTGLGPGRPVTPQLPPGSRRRGALARAGAGGMGPLWLSDPSGFASVPCTSREGCLSFPPAARCGCGCGRAPFASAVHVLPRRGSRSPTPAPDRGEAAPHLLPCPPRAPLHSVSFSVLPVWAPQSQPRVHGGRALSAGDDPQDPGQGCGRGAETAAVCAGAHVCAQPER